MSGYEPSSGWNLPPGCFESDPRAPWNRPDPWEGRTCRECVGAYEYPSEHSATDWDHITGTLPKGGEKA